MDDFISSLFLARALNGERGYCARRDLPDGRVAVVEAGVLLNAQLKITDGGEPERGYNAVF